MNTAKKSFYKLFDLKIKGTMFLLMILLSIPTIVNAAGNSGSRGVVYQYCCVPGTQICVSCPTGSACGQSATGPYCKNKRLDGVVKGDKFSRIGKGGLFYGNGSSNATVKKTPKATAPMGRAPSANFGRNLR